MLQLEISSSDVLRIETEDIIEHYPGIVTLNKVFLLMAKLILPLSNIVASMEVLQSCSPSIFLASCGFTTSLH